MVAITTIDKKGVFIYKGAITREQFDKIDQNRIQMAAVCHDFHVEYALEEDTPSLRITMSIQNFFRLQPGAVTSTAELNNYMEQVFCKITKHVDEKFVVKGLKNEEKQPQEECSHQFNPEDIVYIPVPIAVFAQMIMNAQSEKE